MMKLGLELAVIGILFAAMQNTHGASFIDRFAARFIIDHVALAIRKGHYV
jgi:hypothetical protein